MSTTLAFESEFGTIFIEASDEVEDVLRSGTSTTVPLSSSSAEEPVEVPKKFDEALGSLSAYARSVQSVLQGLSPVPTEASMQVGLKLDASLNFKIVKVGSGADLTINVKWDPREGKA